MVNEIVHRIFSVAKPDKIILFGSAISEQLTLDSDIDLLIVEAAPDDLTVIYYKPYIVKHLQIFLYFLSVIRKVTCLNNRFFKKRIDC